MNNSKVRALAARASQLLLSERKPDITQSLHATYTGVDATPTGNSSLLGIMKKRDLHELNVFHVHGDFFFSRFMVALVVNYFLVNRIENIVPPRRPIQFRLSSLQRFSYFLPSLLLLFHSIIRLFLIGATPDDDVPSSWTIYLSLVITNVSETFIRAIENRSSARFSIEMPALAIILYNRSKHFTSFRALSADERLYLYEVDHYLYITLIEIFILHLISCLPRKFQISRLWITGSTSIITQLEGFHSIYRSLKNRKEFMITRGSIWAGHRAMEVIMEAIIISHLFISTLTVLVREGRNALTKERIFGQRDSWMRGQDRWELALLKYLCNVLETSQLTGLSNEFPALNFDERSEVLITRTGATCFGRKGSGLTNEIQTVRVQVEGSNETVARWREMKRLFRILSRICNREEMKWRRRFERIKNLWKREDRLEGWTSFAPLPPVEVEIDISAHSEDSEWGSDSEGETSDESDSLDLDVDGDDGGEGEEDEDSLEGLYREMRENDLEHGENDQSLILVAHLSSRARLTRQSWLEKNGGNLARTIRKEKAKEVSERSGLCIICWMERRNVVLWPCRCMSMCEDCRSELAERAGNERCPSCRTKIEGYSRVFLP